MSKKQFYILAPLTLILLALSLFLGNIPPSPVYYLKFTRETIQTFFIFGDEDRANWLLVRADKRLEEAQKLKTKHLGYFSDLQIKTAENYQDEAGRLIEDLKNKTNTTYLQDRFNQNSDKLKTLESN